MPIPHIVKAEKKSGELPKEEQLAWKIAELAHNTTDDDLAPGVAEMVKCRLIDNAAIAIAAINEEPVAVAREKAVASRGKGKATLYGMSPGNTYGPSEAAFANAVAVRFRDQDDTYLNAEYAHPDDNISPLLAVAQHMGRSGKDLVRGIAVAYEVHVALAGTGDGTGICLHKHKVDHMTHIAAASAAGIGAMLNLPTEQIYHAVNFAVHNAISSRQSRKGDIGAQKEFVPGISAQIAIDAVDAAMHDLKGPNPVYEGVDSIIRRFLDGRDNPDAEYKITLAEPGKDKLKNMLLTYPKEHAFEYQGQAIIDLALELREKLPKKPGGSIDLNQIQHIVLETSHHTHHVIGTGANDPQKIDPNAPRGTLDHSIMFAIARTLQLGKWDEDAYNIKPDEKEELRALMEKIETKFDQGWETAYHSMKPQEQAFGGHMIIELNNGDEIKQAKARANAHVFSDKPWTRDDYVKKFEKLTERYVGESEKERFLQAVDTLEDMTAAAQLQGLTARIDRDALIVPRLTGIYDHGRQTKMAKAV